MKSSKIRVHHLGKHYGRGERRVHALSDINLDVFTGEFVTLVGASGCGKSTLLRTIGGLEEYSEGDIFCNGHLIDGPGADRAMVFQSYSLFQWLTVADNIRFAGRLKHHRREKYASAAQSASSRAEALVQLTGLAHVAHAFPAELSGGMQQRVAIARALMCKPDVLLMDEPFGALDAQTREVMHELIRHVHCCEKTTVLFVTHDVEEALYLGNRVVVMAPRPGRIDSIIEVPFGQERRPDLKLTSEFNQLKKRVLQRISATSGARPDLGQLASFANARSAAPSGF